MTDDSVVWVRGHNGSGSGVFHTDKDCHRLGEIHDPIPKRRQLIEDFREECSVCRNGQPRDGDQDRSHYQSLRQAGQEDDE